MILDLIVTNTDDGFSSIVPSINGCESWAHSEDEVIEKSIELLRFYLKLSDQKIKIDLARKIDNQKIYKIFFDK